jgi:type I restriction enzyme R subunit
MTTGVDAQTCKIIALDSNINSMTEFKQIIGRGTRIREEFGKTYFTILDFRKATELFADPDFDGPAIQVKEVKEGEDFAVEGDDVEIEPTVETPEYGTVENPTFIDGGDIEDGQHEKVYVDDVPVSLIYRQTQFLDQEGKLITESLKDYTKKQILQEYSSLDDFINNWDQHKKKYYILEALSERGVLLNELLEDMGEVGKELDPFDLIMHVAFDQKKMVTRKERASRVRKINYLSKYSGVAQEVLEALLSKYADEGIQYIEDINILKVPPFTKIGSPVEIVKIFGGRDKYFQAIQGLEKAIYIG